MDVIIPVTVLAVVLGLAFTRALRDRRAARTDHSGDGPSVTLSVLPGRKAVVTVEADPARSPGAAHLVDQAVRDAFAFDGVDGVEVRSAHGELLERRLRPVRAAASTDRPLRR